MAIMVKGKLKKWGNSFGVIIPKEIVDGEGFKDEQEIEFLIIKNNNAETFKKLFGSLRGKLKQTGLEIKDELREDLYDDD